VIVVEEPSERLIQWNESLHVADRAGILEEFPVKLRRDRVPSQDDGRSQALQDVVPGGRR